MVDTNTCMYSLSLSHTYTHVHISVWYSRGTAPMMVVTLSIHKRRKWGFLGCIWDHEGLSLNKHRGPVMASAEPGSELDSPPLSQVIYWRLTSHICQRATTTTLLLLLPSVCLSVRLPLSLSFSLCVCISIIKGLELWQMAFDNTVHIDVSFLSFFSCT